MSDYPTLKEYVLKHIKSKENRFKVTIPQETKDLMENVLDILPKIEFENGKPFHPSIMVYGIDFLNLNVELGWRYPAITSGRFEIGFKNTDEPLSYSVYIAETHYHKSGKGTFESLCSELAHEFHKFCMDF